MPSIIIVGELVAYLNSRSLARVMFLNISLKFPAIVISFIESRNPQKRIGSPEDIAGLAIFLCSRAGAYTVGATIPSDGGLVGTAGHDLS